MMAIKTRSIGLAGNGEVERMICLFFRITHRVHSYGRMEMNASGTGVLLPIPEKTLKSVTIFGNRNSRKFSGFISIFLWLIRATNC